MNIESPSGNVDAGIRRFAGRNPEYYLRVFRRLHDATGVVASFNLSAALAGPLWAGARGVWNLFWLSMLAEILALVQIGRGWMGQAGSAALRQAAQLQAAAAERMEVSRLAARAGDTATADTFARIAGHLHTAAQQSAAAAAQSAGAARRLLMVGIALLLLVKLLEGLLANAWYERQYSRWRVRDAVPSGFSPSRFAIAALLLLAVYPLTILRFVAEHVPAALLRVPVDKARFAAAASAIDVLFDHIYRAGSGIFDLIRDTIRMLVGVLDTLLVETPWPVVMTVILAAAWRMAGRRVALFTAVAVAYLALLGLWESSMQTVALLGTAALICIAIGIPLGIWFARSDRAYAIARPILDLMQTMPAIVYLIPAIAFFGTGTPPGIIATMIFGMPPVVRLTALGLRQVPADVREGARAFGASSWQLLTGVELPLAWPSIMAGVNQTILMCLSMVVVAALIGAQGLGSTVLEALQYAATGQGILAGGAILLCAIVIDRLVQGAFGGAPADHGKS